MCASQPIPSSFFPYPRSRCIALLILIENKCSISCGGQKAGECITRGALRTVENGQSEEVRGVGLWLVSAVAKNSVKCK